MKKWTVLLLFLFSFSLNASTNNPTDAISEFFEHLIKGDISSAYDGLFLGSSIPTDKPQAVMLVKQQTKNGLALYGNMLGYELITKQKYGKSIIRFVYVLKTQKAPIVWEFYFYKPKEKWFLANVVFNDQLNLLR